jgi:hypothetical protein
MSCHSLQAQTDTIEKGNILDQDEGGNTSDGSEERRAGEGSGTSNDGGRSRNAGVHVSNLIE